MIYTKGEYKIQVSIDLDPIDPMEYDRLGTMVCIHRRYKLGDIQRLPSDDFEEKFDHETGILLPLYLYDHSGISISTKRFDCRWDTSRFGYIYCEKLKILKEFGTIDNDILLKVEKNLLAEVDAYDRYLRGESYVYMILCDDIVIDSCGGFDDSEICKNSAYESLAYFERLDLENQKMMAL